MMRFWIGETIRVRCEFVDDESLPLAVSGVSITAKAPDSTHINGMLVADAQVGAYYADFPLAQSGIWSFRAVCDSPSMAAVEDQVECRPSYVL